MPHGSLLAGKLQTVQHKSSMFTHQDVMCLYEDKRKCAYAVAGVWEAINVLDAAYSNNKEFQPRTLSIAVQDKPGVLNEVWSCTAQRPFEFMLFRICLLDYPACCLCSHTCTTKQQLIQIYNFTPSACLSFTLQQMSCTCMLLYLSVKSLDR